MDIGCFCLCMICYHINSFCCGCSTYAADAAVCHYDVTPKDIFLVHCHYLWWQPPTGINKKCKCK